AVFCETLASVFVRRISVSAAATEASSSGATVESGWLSDSSVVHGARWTEPVRHHDQTSSVTNGMIGANSQQHIERSGERDMGRSLVVGSGGPVGTVLDEFDVVVGEFPEEALGHSQRVRIVVIGHMRTGLVDDLGQLRQQRTVEVVS